MYTLRFRAVNRDIFEAIKHGTKKVETRAATIKYRNIKAGDAITFSCGKDRFRRQVKRATIFSTIAGMLKKHRIQDINPKCATAKELRDMYNAFPEYSEKIKNFGIIAFELKNI